CRRETANFSCRSLLWRKSRRGGTIKADHVATRPHGGQQKLRPREAQRKAAGDGVFEEPELMDGVSNFRLSEFVMKRLAGWVVGSWLITITQECVQRSDSSSREHT